MYRLLFSSATFLGIFKPIAPLTDRPLCPFLLRVCLVLHWIVVISYPRNLAALSRVWVINVFSSDNSSLSSSCRNVLSCCLMASASSLGPTNARRVRKPHCCDSLPL